MTDDEFAIYLSRYDEAVHQNSVEEFFAKTPLPLIWKDRFEMACGGLEQLDAFWDSYSQQEKTNSEIDPTSFQIGRFEIINELGRGGFGIVYRAWDPKFERDVAIKVPRIDNITNPDHQARFFREGEMAAGLTHPHIVPILEVISFGSYCCMVSELCTGGTLAAHLSENELTPPQIACLIRCLADAIDYCHQKGIFHRDIKPANVMLKPEPFGPLPFTPRLVDFGLAKPFSLTEISSNSSMFLGTPEYMAPEQIDKQFGKVGPLTDIYGLGLVLMELLNHRPLFAGHSFPEIIDQVRFQTPLPHHEAADQQTQDLETIGLKCLRKFPARRYQSARALVEELDRVVGGTEIESGKSGWLGGSMSDSRSDSATEKRLTIAHALSELAGHDAPFKKLFEHGTLEVEIYKPVDVDLQTPHTRDEIYVVTSGSGTFINGDQTHPFEAGEVLFVPAGVEHRFVDFTDDFATWVFFYGPEGGE